MYVVSVCVCYVCRCVCVYVCMLSMNVMYACMVCYDMQCYVLICTVLCGWYARLHACV